MRAVSALALACEIGGLGVVGVLGRDRVLLQQRWHSGRPWPWRSASVASGVVIGRLIGRRIDLIERLAGLDGRAFGEQPLLG